MVAMVAMVVCLMVRSAPGCEVDRSELTSPEVMIE